VASQLSHAGDTHGWHWDDYAYAFVWIMKTPPKTGGGSLEYVPHTHWNRKNPNVPQVLRDHAIHSRHPDEGSAYLLRSDTSLHRVAPLLQDASRLIINFVFADKKDLTKEVSHETMERMFPEACKPEQKD